MNILEVVLVGFLAAAQAENPAPIKHGNETPLVEIKMEPEEFVGRELIVCVGLVPSDYYNFYYMELENVFYTYEGWGLSPDMKSCTKELTFLYLKKKTGKPIVDKLKPYFVKGIKVVPVRAKVVINPAAYADGKKWEYLELLDIQLYDKNEKKWGEWLITSEQKKSQERNRELDWQASSKTWKDDSGKFSVKAAYVGYKGNYTIILEKEDGKWIEVSTKRLCEEDRKWVQEKLREERAAKKPIRRRRR